MLRGTIAELKIKLHGKSILVWIVVFTLIASSLACSQDYLTAVDLTATAVVVNATSAALPSQTLAILPSATQSFSAAGGIGTSSLPDPTSTSIPITQQPTRMPTIAPAAGGTLVPLPDQALSAASLIYYTQSGDTLPSIAIRFGVQPYEISSQAEIPSSGLITPGLLLVIPNRLGATGPSEIAMPDSEVIYSPSALDFNLEEYISQAGGYLSRYREYLLSGWHTGAQVITRVAIENSINPRLLLALLEYQSGWVFGNPGSPNQITYPMGYIHTQSHDLYRQLSWAVSQLSVGFYGWRAGLLTVLTLSGGETIRISPGLNAGTVALQNLFAQLENDSLQWSADLYGANSLPTLFQEMFGNPWLRAQTVEPLYPPSLEQPPMELPFASHDTWAFTGGPHSAWGPDGALAALDFAPRSMEHGCVPSTGWVTASAPGLVVRSENGVVVLDLDGDGREQTGWVIMYLHIATLDRIAVGTWVETNDHLGHPSCEGGVATGTHVHIARKYNGEWILADGPMPFNLSGWISHNGSRPYAGTLTFDDQIATADTVGSHDSLVTRP